MSYWDSISDDRDIFGLPGMTWEEGVAHSLKEIAPAFDYPNGVIIDLGCGPGRLALPAASKYERWIVGVDSSVVQIDRAIEARGDCPDVTFLWGDGEKLPSWLLSAGGAYSMLLFQHLEPKQVESYIRQIADLLLPGGKFRFQYTIGDQHEDRSHGYNAGEMAGYCIQAGLVVKMVETSVMYDQWEWITAVK